MSTTYLNEFSKCIKPSETLAIKALASKLAAEGKSIIDLSAGEPDTDTPEHIKAGAQQAMREGKTKYTAANGIEPLRRALSQKYAKEHGLEFSTAQIVVSNGGKQAIHSCLQVLVRPGDEVLIPAPYWVSFPVLVQIAGGIPKILSPGSGQGFRMTPSQLAAAITPKTRIVIMNSPSNPTGLGYSRQELEAFGEVLKKHDVLVLSDETYDRIVFGDFKFCSFAKACPHLYDRTVTINSFSKTYAMTGWRVGYAAGPVEIMDAMARFQSQTTSNVSSISQYAALSALEGPHDFLEPVRQNFEKRVALAIELIKEVPGLEVPCLPSGGFFVFVRYDALSSGLAKVGVRTSSELCSYLIEKTGVALVPGDAFGDPLAFRISVSASHQNINEGIKRIGKALGELR